MRYKIEPCAPTAAEKSPNFKEKPEPTAEQLIKIIQLINAGVFSLKEAVEDGIVMHNLQIQTIVNNNQVIRIDVI